MWLKKSDRLMKEWVNNGSLVFQFKKQTNRYVNLTISPLPVFIGREYTFILHPSVRPSVYRTASSSARVLKLFAFIYGNVRLKNDHLFNQMSKNRFNNAVNRKVPKIR